MRTGGCQCGAVRFMAARERLAAYACHCLECQRQSASAFGISVPVPRAAFTIEGGLGVWSRPTDSGRRTECAFCAACGVRIFHAQADAALVTIKGGTFDQTDDLTPRAHLWVSRKQAWVALPQGVPAFDTQPENFRAWRLALVEGAA